ncbi:MAG: deoxyribodipyrimidine photo-lyase [Leptolyngbya sp.]|nr:deoxyribodipyrimidine photo-lyase [Candidatus Melainabacteria bacterium]
MPPSASPVVVWFRQDLRVEDNPALVNAVERGGPVIPLFIWSPAEEGNWESGGATKWWLHHSLENLSETLKKLGSPLILREGDSLKALRKVIKETGAGAVFWNRRYEPSTIERDKNIKSSLKDDGIDVQSFNGSLLFEPWQIMNGKNEPYKVFTAFYKNATALITPPTPLDRLDKLPKPKEKIESLAVSDLKLMPKIKWYLGMTEEWTPGERGAKENLDNFIDGVVDDYIGDRNIPSVVGTSKISPYLHFGEISPRQVWYAVKAKDKTSAGRDGKNTYLKEIVWREFAYHLIYHFPHTAEKPLRPEFEKFPWRDDKALLEAWQKGMTGYPLVDAGMRELWHTGWMHNRIRMVVASFLVKDLILPWQEGAKWFWDTLVDADLASNTLGWQWSAGCGADAAPYFRVFNPILQSEKFDPKGKYIRKWVPEIAKLEDKWIHKPWEAPELLLKAAGVELGKTYPKPIVDHSFARNRALEAFKQIKSKSE